VSAFGNFGFFFLVRSFFAEGPDENIRDRLLYK